MSTDNLDLSFDDILKDVGIDQSDEKPMPTVDELQAQLEQERAEKERAIQSRDKVSQDYKSLRSNYDKVNDRYVKTIGFVEGTGIAKYDPDTGALIKVEKQTQQTEQSPDFGKMEKDLSRQMKSLDRKLAKGDIDHQDYLADMEELRQEQNDLLTKKIEYKSKQSVKPTQEPPKVQPQVHQDFKPAEPQSAMDEYNRIADEMPELKDTNSPLWQEMNRVFQSNPDYFDKGNPNGGKGDPNIYRQLIQKANENLRSGRSDIFQTPRNQGYQERTPSKTYLTKEDTQNLIAKGFDNKQVLNDINTSLGRWMESGGREAITMDF